MKWELPNCFGHCPSRFALDRLGESRRRRNVGHHWRSFSSNFSSHTSLSTDLAFARYVTPVWQALAFAICSEIPSVLSYRVIAGKRLWIFVSVVTSVTASVCCVSSFLFVLWHRIGVFVCVCIGCFVSLSFVVAHSCSHRIIMYLLCLFSSLLFFVFLSPLCSVEWCFDIVCICGVSVLLLLVRISVSVSVWL